MKPTVSALALSSAATLLEERETKIHGASLPTWRKNSTKRPTRSKPKRVPAERSVATFTRLHRFAAQLGSSGVVTRPLLAVSGGGSFRLFANDMLAAEFARLSYVRFTPIPGPRKLAAALDPLRTFDHEATTTHSWNPTRTLALLEGLSRGLISCP